MSGRKWIGLWFLLVTHSLLFGQAEVLFSHQGGFYEEPFALTLACSDFNIQIRYTTNGNKPTVDSKLYEQPLWLDEQMYSISDIFSVPTCVVYEPFVPDSVNHAIVVRAAAFNADGQCVSDVVTRTFFIRSLGCDHGDLPVVSLCCDSLALFDYNTGIMVPGVFYDPSQPELTGNYFQRGRDWERLANVEFYEPDNSGINQQCGLRMHGNRARKAVAKGMKIYAREEYGKKNFKHRFFDTTPIIKFKHLVLKPLSTLWPCVGVQDDMANRMALQMGLEAPSSRPVALYLNGEYWGLYFLQEKLDDHYLEDHFDVVPERCNIISNWGDEVESGDDIAFWRMMDWLENADLSDEANYSALKELVDVDNFIDYQILETFIGNWDWPANNARCWQEDNSKWRFAFFDGDATMTDTDFDALENATYVGADRWQTGGKSTLLMRRLLENNDFKRRFENRVNELCNSVLQYESTKPLLDGLEQAMRAEMSNHIARFGYPENMEQWDLGMVLVRVFLQGRVAAYQQACSDFESLKEHDYQSNTNDFVVYPNPVEEEVNIMMLDGRSREVDYELVDVLGRSYNKGTAYIPACTVTKLQVDLRPGVYILKIGGEAHRVLKL